ncbi:hypothetical protein EV121DRAFT_277656 [Schizophyllum commune]
MKKSHRVLRSIEETHRVLRSTHLEPLHKLQGWDFIDAWFQCAEAHYFAWTHGIHHQDPSLNNLMYRGRRDGKTCPVLNDWDVCAALNDWDLATDTSVLAIDASVLAIDASVLAIDASVLPIDAIAPQTHTGLQRAGTMQFMAIARLESEAWGGYLADHLQHLYRHDLETFFYILAWVVCCYKEGRRLDPLPPFFETWMKGDGTNARACLDSKRSFIHDELWPHDSLPTNSWSSAMKVFANCIRAFFADILRRPEPSKESRRATFRAQLEGRALAPSGRALAPPQEDDRPTEIWEGFCDAVKEGLLILSIDNRTNLKKEDIPPRLASFLPDRQMGTAL